MKPETKKIVWNMMDASNISGVLKTFVEEVLPEIAKDTDRDQAQMRSHPAMIAFVDKVQEMCLANRAYWTPKVLYALDYLREDITIEEYKAQFDISEVNRRWREHEVYNSKEIAR